jgi:hypothetical protein
LACSGKLTEWPTGPHGRLGNRYDHGNGERVTEQRLWRPRLDRSPHRGICVGPARPYSARTRQHDRVDCKYLLGVRDGPRAVPTTVKALITWSWPGNVRELESARSCALSRCRMAVASSPRTWACLGSGSADAEEIPDGIQTFKSQKRHILEVFERQVPHPSHDRALRQCKPRGPRGRKRAPRLGETAETPRAQRSVVRRSSGRRRVRPSSPQESSWLSGIQSSFDLLLIPDTADHP